MKKIFAFLLCCLAISSCSKHDPILPGVRHDIFDTTDVKIENKNVPELSKSAKEIYGDKDCEYKQDISNNIWQGDKKIYDGFAMDNVVKSGQSPICSGQFIYAGLSTGEVVKINKSNKKVVWTADVYRGNNLTGGAAVVDIVAHVGLDGKYVFAGGLGDAFCKLNASNGNKVWCVNVSVPVDFIIIDNFAFVVGTDYNLYAINIDDGSVYWRTEVKKQVAPKYDGKNIIIKKQKIDYKTGEIVK
jgi:outer membrane protein assembly factor BamB